MIRNSCVIKIYMERQEKTIKTIHMFKEAIIPLMFPPGDDCGEFKSMRLAGGVSTGPLTVDDPEAWFTSVGVERWGAETISLAMEGERWAAAVLSPVTSWAEL